MLQVLPPYPIEATPAPYRSRAVFLPRHFGLDAVAVGERTVYTLMTRIAADYSGGYWEFYNLTNGGFYMAPLAAPRWRIAVKGNGFDGVLSANAAGVVVTLFALFGLAFEFDGTGLEERMVVDHCRLRDYAETLPEAHLIFQAVG